MTTPTEATNTGHGHVRPRPDGVKARCGGPTVCRVCQQDRASLAQQPSAPAGWGVTYDGQRVSYVYADESTAADEARQVGGSARAVAVYLVAQQPSVPSVPTKALLAIATGQIAHTYAESCPDGINGAKSRDPECPACQAIIAAENTHPSAPSAMPPQDKLHAAFMAGTPHQSNFDAFCDGVAFAVGSAPSAEPAAEIVTVRHFHEYEGSALEDTTGYLVTSVRLLQPEPTKEGVVPLYAGAAPQQTAPQAGTVGAPELLKARWEGIQSVQAQTAEIVRAAIELLDAAGDNFPPETLAAFKRVFGDKAPPAAPVPTAQPLTDAQILACVRSVGLITPMGLTRDRGPYEVTEPTHYLCELVRAIERAHGITLAATPAPTPEE